MSICGRQSENSTSPQGPAAEYEVVHIAKTPNYCGLCDDYAQSQASKPVAVLCCAYAEMLPARRQIICVMFCCRRKRCASASAAPLPRIPGNGTWCVTPPRSSPWRGVPSIVQLA